MLLEMYYVTSFFFPYAVPLPGQHWTPPYTTQSRRLLDVLRDQLKHFPLSEAKPSRQSWSLILDRCHASIVITVQIIVFHDYLSMSNIDHNKHRAWHIVIVPQNVCWTNIWINEWQKFQTFLQLLCFSFPNTWHL